MDQIKKIIEEGHTFGMIQNDAELALFLMFVRDVVKPKKVLEIGTHTGGLLHCLMRVSCQTCKTKFISVDLPWQEHEYTFGDFRGKKKDSVTFIVGDAGVVADQVSKVLDGSKLDFVFIDADHSYDGTKKHFELYSSLVREGGWVGFHDIYNGHGCGDFYKNKLINDYLHVEFGYRRSFGIGCIQV